MGKHGPPRRPVEDKRKLTPEQEREILESSESADTLAARYPVTARTIRGLRQAGGYKYRENREVYWS